MDKKNLLYAQLEGWLSVILNFVLFAFKFWVGMISGSLAITADAWHTLSDSLTSIVVLFGVKISVKPADEDHPYGHGRAELISSVIIGVLLGVVAFEFLTTSIQHLSDHRGADYGALAVWAMIVSIVVKEAMAQYAFWATRKTGMLALKADGWHHRSDAISSLVILSAIIFGRHVWWIDGVMGICLALIIGWTAFDILRESVSRLLGSPATKKMIDRINEICVACGGEDIEAHHFHMHEYGSHTEMSFHIRMDGNLPLHEAHVVAKMIENEIIRELDIAPTIHIDPLDNH